MKLPRRLAGFAESSMQKNQDPETDGNNFFRYGCMLAIFVALGVSIWLGGSGMWRQYFSDSAAVSYRIDAQYRINNQMYTGSGVWHGKLEVAKFPTTSGLGATVIGEAFMLRGGTQNIFLLRRALDRAAGRSYGFYPRLCPHPTGDEYFNWIRSEFTGPCNIKENINFIPPEIVAVPDLTSPKGITKLDIDYWPKSDNCNNCVLRFNITRSDSHPVLELHKILPWLSSLDNDYSEIKSNTTLRSISTATEEHLVLMDFSWK